MSTYCWILPVSKDGTFVTASTSECRNTRSNGAYDEINPEIDRDIAERLQNATVNDFAESSHMPF